MSQRDDDVTRQMRDAARKVLVLTTGRSRPDLSRLIHGYDTIDHDRVWLVATEDVPALARALDRILGASETT